MTKQRDIIVIGAGISGASATLKAAQAGLNVLCLTKPGDPGYWARVSKMHHIPGIEENINGEQFISHIKKRSETFGAVFHDYRVTKITQTETRTFKISGENGEDYETASVIIATGVSKDEHFLAGERELVGKGVYYSVQNEAPLLKHQSATVVGKTEEAAGAVLYLSKFSEKIHFVIPGSKLDIPEKISKELEANKKIEMHFSSSIKKLNGTDSLYSIAILSAGSEMEIKSRAAFIYTYSLTPCTEFAKETIELDKNSGRVLVNPDFATSKTGIFACGDVLAGILQNPAVSAAQGVIAAINAEGFLNS